MAAKQLEPMNIRVAVSSWQLAGDLWISLKNPANTSVSGRLSLLNRPSAKIIARQIGERGEFFPALVDVFLFRKKRQFFEHLINAF